MILLPTQWKTLTKRKKRLAVIAMRLYWFSFHPIIRPLFFCLVLMLLLPKHILALPTALGLGFGTDAVVRAIELLIAQKVNN